MQTVFSQQLRNLFGLNDRNLGHQYFLANRVHLMYADEDAAVGTVRGSGANVYEFAIDALPGGRFDFDCDCPRFDSGFNCKHLWAAVLAWGRELQLQGREIGFVEHAGSLDAVPPRPTVPDWQQQLTQLRRQHFRSPADTGGKLPPVVEDATQFWFGVCLGEQVGGSELRVSLFGSRIKANGARGMTQRHALRQNQLDEFTHPLNREIFSLLRFDGADENGEQIPGASYSYYSGSAKFVVPAHAQERLIPLLASTDRFVWSLDEQHLNDAKPIHWDENAKWHVRHGIATKQDDETQLELSICMVCDAPEDWDAPTTRDVGEVVTATDSGLVLFNDHMARLRLHDAASVRAFQSRKSITFPAAELDSFCEELAKLPHKIELHFDASLGIERQQGTPRPKCVLSSQESHRERDRANLRVDVLMQYAGQDVDVTDQCGAVWDADNRTWTERDTSAERSLIERLQAFPMQERQEYSRGRWLTIHQKWVPQVVRELTDADWDVVAKGKLMRTASSFKTELTTETDWFDVHATADFGGMTVSLPQLLGALRKRQDYVVLDDGSHGMLPEDWLQRYGRLANVAEAEDGKMRFRKSQALLLDALLAEQENVTSDRSFKTICNRINNFQGIKPGKAPRGFHGELRDYQKNGVGWFGFLRDFDFGGCLADDMGLGKTIQVLSMLEARRTQRLKKGEERLPSLAVVPKSLIFNWVDEAARFTPNLRVLNYTGLEREACLAGLSGGDLLVTTYGTLRRDIEQLREIKFDYAILDEAQAIKNGNSQSAKACRLLTSSHRLAMTGTPVENHLGELWSLFDFLNPGMLGNSSAFKSLTSGNVQDGSMEWLSQSLRPFMLRRTKDQVLDELPEKNEQTLYCEMSPKQKKLYGELRDHYRSHVTNKVDEVGIKRSKIHVLEALLRLRQAACDPRLIDKASKVHGAKIDLLIEQLQETVDEGHKALVFSQFTSLLSLVRARVEEQGWDYEYLDGRTRKRGDKVRRFQEEDNCKLFLISLKAGGHGLNLTAADYVFILDPWWNPAVEAQAIDRAHRMGQTRPVMAYRIICRDTVEEKILTLQQSKRDLADSIVKANESLISKLSLEDLQLLFG